MKGFVVDCTDMPRYLKISVLKEIEKIHNIRYHSNAEDWNSKRFPYLANRLDSSGLSGYGALLERDKVYHWTEYHSKLLLNNR